MNYGKLCGLCYQREKSRLENKCKECYLCKRKCIDNPTFLGRIYCEECLMNKRKICGDIHVMCLLNDKCCYCHDKRPYLLDGSYEGYIDGAGYVRNKSRHEFYCSTCFTKYNEIMFSNVSVTTTVTSDVTTAVTSDVTKKEDYDSASDDELNLLF